MSNMTPAALAAFQGLQNSWGQPIQVNSSYRSPADNARVGGAQHSQHMKGNAYDIDVSGLSEADRLRMIADAKAAGFQGVGVYNNALHFDVGPERAWGPSHGRESIPAWAREAVDGRAVAADTMTALGVNQQSRGQPMGLLGSGPQQEQPKQSVLERMTGGFLTPDRTDRAIIAMQGMTMNPNEALARNAQANIAGRADKRATQEQTNKTVALLERMGADPKLIEAARNGYAKEAVAMAFAQPEAQKGIAVGDRIVNPVTGEVIYDGAGSGGDPEGEAKLRKEFTSLPIVKAFSSQSTAYGRVIASVDDPSPAGDLALIFNFMKVLDPGSTVREGEFATAANSGGVDDRVRALYNNVVDGTRLSGSQRDDFANRATRLYGNAEQQYRSIADQYGQFAANAGFDPAAMMPDFGYSGDKYETPLSLSPPQLTGQQLGQLGVKLADWPALWQSFTDSEREQFMEDMR